jgi:hypothetical protein
MALDALAISAMIISGVTAIGGLIAGLHIKRVNSGCCNCDCTPQTPLSRSPTVSKTSIVLQPVKTTSDV